LVLSTGRPVGESRPLATTDRPWRSRLPGVQGRALARVAGRGLSGTAWRTMWPVFFARGVLYCPRHRLRLRNPDGKTFRCPGPRFDLAAPVTSATRGASPA